MEPLNQVLRVLQGWTRPTLMLVGNHDQVRHLQSQQLLCSAPLRIELVLKSRKC